MAHSPILKNGNQDIDCCSSPSGPEFSSFCDPIPVLSSDPFFRGRSSCMNLVRSVPAPALDCSIRYREQVNQLTAWLDLSQVYGSDIEEQRDLRARGGGLLLTSRGPDGGRGILPGGLLLTSRGPD